MKQRAKISNWTRVAGIHANGLGFLIGKVSDHPRQNEFHAEFQQTSRLIAFDEEKGEAETLNTFYTLGPKAEVTP